MDQAPIISHHESIIGVHPYSEKVRTSVGVSFVYPKTRISVSSTIPKRIRGAGGEADERSRTAAIGTNTDLSGTSLSANNIVVTDGEWGATEYDVTFSNQAVNSKYVVVVPTSSSGKSHIPRSRGLQS